MKSAFVFFTIIDVFFLTNECPFKEKRTRAFNISLKRTAH